MPMILKGLAAIAVALLPGGLILASVLLLLAAKCKRKRKG